MGDELPTIKIDISSEDDTKAHTHAKKKPKDNSSNLGADFGRDSDSAKRVPRIDLSALGSLKGGNFLQRIGLKMNELFCGSSEFGAYSETYLFTPREMKSVDASTDPTHEDLFIFILDLCQALMKYGMPIYRIEFLIQAICVRYNVPSQVACLPGVIILALGPAENQKTLIGRGSSGLNCEKLHLTDELAVRICRKAIPFVMAKQRLNEINATPPRFPQWVQMFAMGISSATIAPLFFSGGWREMLYSFGLGILVGLLGLVASTNETFSRIYEAVAAILVAFLTRIIVGYAKNVCFNSVALSGLVWLLPGLSITLSMVEMATRNIVSGTARFFGGFLTAVKIGFGIAIGSKLAFWLAQPPKRCDHHLPEAWNALWFPAAVFSWNLLMDAHPWQWPIMSVCAAIGYTVSWGLARLGTSPDVATAIAAFAIGTVGNMWARVTGHSAITGVLGGILILVPGSIGVRGVTALLQNDISTGISFAFTMIVIALAIGVGVFVANLLIIPLAFDRTLATRMF